MDDCVASAKTKDMQKLYMDEEGILKNINSKNRVVQPI